MHATGVPTRNFSQSICFIRDSNRGHLMNFQAHKRYPRLSRYQDDWLVNTLVSQSSSRTVVQLSAGPLENELEVGRVVQRPLGTVGHPQSRGYSIQEQSLMSRKEYQAVHVRDMYSQQRTALLTIVSSKGVPPEPSLYLPYDEALPCASG